MSTSNTGAASILDTAAQNLDVFPFHTVARPIPEVQVPHYGRAEELNTLTNDALALKLATSVVVMGREIDSRSYQRTYDANEYYRERFEQLTVEKDELQRQHESLQEEFNELEEKFNALSENNHHQQEALIKAVELMKDRVDNLTKQVNALPADAGSGSGPRVAKMDNVQTFSGSDAKVDVRDWIRQLKLYLSHMAINTDKQQIIYALSRLRQPASLYFADLYDKNSEGKDIGTWDEFVKTLLSIYGQKDDKEAAKKEFTQLWTNKALAKKDFIKYAEQFKTLGRLVEYEDQLLIDKLDEVIDEDLFKSARIAKMVSSMPTKWQEYLDRLLELHKAFDRNGNDKRIFGKDKDSSSKDKPQPQSKAKEANSTETATKFCQICSGMGKTKSAKTHNTADCYSKPGNESKRPAPKASSSTKNTTPQAGSSSGGSTGNNKGKGKPAKTLKARLMELLEGLDEDDNEPGTSAGDVNLNTARIEEIHEDVLMREAEEPKPSSKRGGKGKSKESNNSDFPKSM